MIGKPQETYAFPVSLCILSSFKKVLLGERGASLFGTLVAGGLSAHFLQQFPHCIELRAETFPISGLQPLHCPVVAIERLLRATCRLARDGRLYRRSIGFNEQRRQGLGERLLHHHMLAVGRDHTFQLRQVSVLRPQIERRYIEEASFRS